MTDNALSILVHGPAGAGKTTFGLSGPAPCLMMDVENASRFVKKKKITWKPMEESPPVYDGSWEVCVVKVKDWKIALKTYEWLKSGAHPFRSVSIDSISETQIKGMEDINGRNQMQTQHWGRLLQNMGGFLRDLRDVMDDDSSIETMALISTSRNDNGRWKPHLQGSIAFQVPYLFDITGYLFANQVANPETGELEEHRFLFTGNHPDFEAKSRADIPATIQDPTLTMIMDNIFRDVD